MSARSGLAARTLSLTVVAAVVLAGCAREDPRQEFERAVRATARTSVTFDLTARADRGALDTLGDGAAEAAAFLDGAAIRGGRDPDGAIEVGITIGGMAPLLEAVADVDGTLVLRTGLGALLGLEGTDPTAQLDRALTGLGIDEAGRRALAVSFAGGWVEVTGIDGLGDLAAGLAGDSDRVDARSLGAREVLDHVTVLGARDAGEVRRLDIVVAIDDLLRSLGAEGEVPLSTAPGTVVLRDGLVQEVRVELTADGSDGLVELVLTLTPSEQDVVDRPDAEASLTAAELTDLVDRLQAAQPGR